MKNVIASYGFKMVEWFQMEQMRIDAIESDLRNIVYTLLLDK